MANNDQMDMRDIFAMAALQGLLSNGGGPIQSNQVNGWNWVNCNIPDVAAISYQMADAMLTERVKRMENGHE